MNWRDFGIGAAVVCVIACCLGAQVGGQVGRWQVISGTWRLDGKDRPEIILVDTATGHTRFLIYQPKALHPEWGNGWAVDAVAQRLP
jgi:hypothetical protein